MTDPRRMIDDESSSELERSLLRSAQNESAPSGSRKRVLLAVTVATAAGATALGTSTAGAATGTALRAAAAKKVGFVLLGAGALLAGGHAVVNGVAENSTATTIAHGVKSARVETPSAPLTRLEPSAPKQAIAVDGEQEVVPPKTIPLRRTGISTEVPVAESPASNESTPNAEAEQKRTRLAEEANRLESARRAVAAQQGQQALALLDSYHRDFPNGAFAPEARALRIRALDLVGQHDTAARLGKDFVESHPLNPAAESVRKVLRTDPKE